MVDNSVVIYLMREREQIVSNARRESRELTPQERFRLSQISGILSRNM